MLWRKAARTTLAAGLTFQQASAKLITITEYPTSCKAIYTSGTRSVTIVRSSIIVSPTPWTESGANNGEPFVLEVEGATGNYRRQTGERRLVKTDGSITTSEEDAAQYMIDEEGRLTSADGGYISMDGSTRHEIFAFSPTLKSVNTEFSIEDGVLTWANDEFTGGSAQFFQVGVGVNGDASRVLVRFTGRINPNWEPISLAARTPYQGSQSVSATTSSARNTRATGGGATDGGNTRHTRSRTRGHNEPSATGTRTASNSPLASGSVSPDGSCGGDSGYTCIGSGFGDCCSRRGECGSGKRFCNNGCQPLYGICMAGSSSAMSSMSSMSWPVTISISLPSISVATTLSGSSSISIPISTFTSTAGPIGPIDNSLFPSRSSTAGAASGQNPVSSAGMSASSTTPSQPPVAVCPTSTADLCGYPDNSATCSSPGGTPYNNTCGILYRGPVIDTSGIVGLPARRGVAYQGTEIDTNNVVGLRKRATEYSLADCRTLCDRFTDCVVFNYIDTTNNCTLLSGITGTDYQTGAVGGSVPPEYVEAKTNPSSASAPAPPAESSAAAVGSSPAVVQSSAGPGMGVQSSQAPAIVSNSNLDQGSTNSNPGMVMSSSSSPQMTMSTISEAVTGSTAGAAPVVTSSPGEAPSTGSLASTAEQELPSSNPLSVVSQPTAVSSSLPSSPTGNPACPAANGTDYFDPSGNEFVVLCDVDFNTPVVDLSQQATFEACVDSCASPDTVDCDSVTFVPNSSGDGSGTCNYHADYSGTVPRAGVSAAVLASDFGSSAPQSNPSSSAEIPATSNAASSTISSPVLPSSSTAPSSSAVITSAAASSSTAMSSSLSASPTPTRTYYLVLASPTPCDFGDYADDGTPLDEDDSFCEIDLPFAMRMYSEHDTFTYASTNGYISLSSGSSQYGNQPFPASNLPANAVAPFFDDLYIVGNSKPQSGIFYEIDGGTVTYEYYLNRGANSGDAVDPSVVYHFTVFYDSAQPGIFTYTYYEMGDAGQYAAVGMQGRGSAGAEIGFTYSYMSPSITSGLVVRCNTLTNTCITVSR